MPGEKTDGDASKTNVDLDKVLNGDDDKSKDTPNPFEVELAKAKEELELANTIARQKTGALKERDEEIARLKGKVTDTPPAANADDVVIINGVSYAKSQVEAIRQIALSEQNKVWDEMNKKQQDSYLATLIPNKSERELVQFHLENTLKGGTGNLEKDVANARILANVNIKKESDDDNDDFLAGITAGSPSAPNSNNRFSGTPEEQTTKRQAASMLANMGIPADKIKGLLEK